MSKLDRFKSKDAPAKAAESVDDNVIEFPSRQAKGVKFIAIAIDDAAEFAKAAGTPSAMVWLMLYYLAWKTKKRTFELSNQMLVPYGVTRWTKDRALARLVREGKIEIMQRGHQSVTVRLRVKPKLAK
jgi:hypothetical protein